MTFQRVSDEPLLVRTSLPDLPPFFSDPSSVFNPGAARYGDAAVLLLRVQSRGRRTFLLPALHDDHGIRFADQPTEFEGLPTAIAGEIHHIYDPRLTWLDDVLHVVTALDTDHGCRLAIWRAAGDRADLAGLDRLVYAGSSTHADTRNGVLFPSRIDGRYLMFERPNRDASNGGPTSGSQVTLSATADFETWDDLGPVMTGRARYWDELIGAGPPPILTEAGWLLVYHGVATHFASVNIYQAGAALFAADDPTRLLARTPDNILEPRLSWEMTGQVPNVVFPSGLTSEIASGMVPRESRLHLYYGAADTAIGLATATVGDLIDACEPC